MTKNTRRATKADVTRCATKLAKFIVSEIEEAPPELVLSYFYTPYVAAWLVYSDKISSEFGGLPPRSLRELYSTCKGITDTRFRTGVQEPSVEQRSLRKTVGTYRLPSTYERILFKVCGFDVESLELAIDDESTLVARPIDARLRQCLLSKAVDETVKSLIKFMPFSLLEMLIDSRYEFYRERAYAHGFELLNPNVNLDEHYAFYIACAKASGRTIFGLPHGGYYFQAKDTDSFQVCEQSLSDLYQAPSWIDNEQLLPNMRVSKNLFLARKNAGKKLVRRSRYAHDTSVLVILPYYWGELNTTATVKCVARTVLRIVEINETPINEIVIKFHPLERSADVEEFAHAAGSRLGGIRITVAREKECRELIVLYRTILVMSAFATALFELAALKRFIYICVEKSVLLTSYQNFLRAKAISRLEEEDVTIVKIDSTVFARAYYASYLYPVKIAREAKRRTKPA